MASAPDLSACTSEQVYSFFRRYSKPTYPIMAETIAIRKFAGVTTSRSATARLWMCFEAVNSPIRRFE
jgi:hypothetical protein